VSGQQRSPGVPTKQNYARYTRLYNVPGRGRSSIRDQMSILISYRRSDAPGTAGRIADRLRQHYGDDSVFMDVDSIPLGLDFRKYIKEALDRCDIMLAIIGPRWIGEKEFQRIQDETDFVRIELETALQRDIPVVPVLVDGATIPRPDLLPEKLQDLIYRQTIEVDNHRDFNAAIDHLIKALDRSLANIGTENSNASHRLNTKQGKLKYKNINVNNLKPETSDNTHITQLKAFAITLAIVLLLAISLLYLAGRVIVL
jgi:hypothetical protein